MNESSRSDSGRPPSRFRVLLAPESDAPVAAEVGEKELVAGLDWSPTGDRPHVAMNMISTADGHATIAGRSGPIGDPADRALFRALRARAHAVLVGAGTLRAERYGPLVRDGDVRARRSAAGLAAMPLACVVSASLRLPQDLPLLRDPSSRVLVITASAETLPASAAQVEYLRVSRAGEGVDLREALRRLRAEHGVTELLCEGGPTLNRALLAAGLVDELLLSFAPMISAEDAAHSIVAGPGLADPARMRLATVHEAGSTLFLRYLVGGDGQR